MNKLAEEIAWLRKFINCVPFGANAPQTDIERAHYIISTLAALRAEREPATEAVRDAALEEAAKVCMNKNGEWISVEARTIGSAIRALKGKGASQGDEVVVTTDEAGACIAVTRQDDEGHILKVIWKAPEPSGEFVRVPRTVLLECRNRISSLWEKEKRGAFSDLAMFLGTLDAMLAACPDEQKG